MKRNEDKVNAYSNELTSLKSGQFAMDKIPDETTEEFAERLKDVGETEYQPEGEHEGAYLSNMNQFKTNMKSITWDVALIDSLMRTFNAKQLYNLNKTFTGLSYSETNSSIRKTTN
jgi:hypothetical protein